MYVYRGRPGLIPIFGPQRHHPPDPSFGVFYVFGRAGYEVDVGMWYGLTGIFAYVDPDIPTLFVKFSAKAHVVFPDHVKSCFEHLGVFDIRQFQ